MPGIADAETGLSAFFQQNIGAVLTGIIVADVFATIASTSNGLLVAMGQALNHDLLPRLFNARTSRFPLSIATMVIGLITMVASLGISGSVVSVALSSVSLMGAGVAAAVMIKVMRWHHTSLSLLCSMLAGIAAALVWKQTGLASTFNEAGVGMAVGLVTNFLVRRIAFARTAVVTGVGSN